MISCASATSDSIRSSGASIDTASWIGPQFDPAAMRPDAGHAQNIRTGRLYRKITDRARVEFADAGADVQPRVVS